MIKRTSSAISTGSRRLAAAMAAAAAGVLIAVAATTPAAATTYTVSYSPINGVIPAIQDPNSSPPGANNWTCRPSAAHPRPVVLVHGTFGDMRDNWDSLSPLLANNGYCVFALNYGGPAGNLIQAVNDIPTSAGQLSSFIDQVLAATGAPKVDIVGHSQGGMMPRYYLNFLGGAPKVNTLVGISPSSHGTTVDGMTTLANTFRLTGIVNSLLSPSCTACVQQENGSAFITRMNSVPDTVPGVNYTVIETKYDLVVTPYTSEWLTGPAVTNILLQDQCGGDFSGHVGIAFSPNALADVLNALDPANATPVQCKFYGPGV